MGAKGDRKSLEEMMAQLMEDCQKQEEEITAEWARREEEITAEWKRRKEECKAQEREVKLQMEAMQARNYSMKVVEDSNVTSAAKLVSKLSGVTLMPLFEMDNIEAYLVTFERIREAHKVDKGWWAHYLPPQLTGWAQLAFAALPTADSGMFKSIKAAILQRKCTSAVSV